MSMDSWYSEQRNSTSDLSTPNVTDENGSISTLPLVFTRTHWDPDSRFGSRSKETLSPRTDRLLRFGDTGSITGTPRKCFGRQTTWYTVSENPVSGNRLR